MKIKSLDKLQGLIDADFVWRKKELIDLKLAIQSTKNPVSIRAGFALLSAHFEGFIRQVANYYILYVSCQKIPFSSLKCNFAAIHVSKKIKTSAESEKISVHSAFLSSFLKDYENANFQIRFNPDEHIIKTGGNPTSKVFEEIICSIGMDFSIYETKRNYIDTDLLSNRHKIVHGERVTLSETEFTETLKNVLDIMDKFQEQVFNAACNKFYLK